MTRVCVFGGARSGHDPRYRAAAEALGGELAGRKDTVVYGGGRIGMMGHLADAALAGGARVIGIIPAFLDHADIVHDALDEKIVVSDLFERKARMMELADAFVAMPGGLGTIDELLEVITWRQLRQSHKPIGVLDTGGFFSPLFTVFERLAETGFANAVDFTQVHRDANPRLLLDRLAAETREADEH